MTVISAGVIVTDGEMLLLGHATGNSYWDLPKGLVDEGEDECSAAIRELAEETGLVVTVEQLTTLGRHAYRKGKDLSLWLFYSNPMPDTKTLVCSSMFVNHRGVTVPELDSFKIIHYRDLEKYTAKSMYSVLKKVLKIS